MQIGIGSICICGNVKGELNVIDFGTMHNLKVFILKIKSNPKNEIIFIPSLKKIGLNNADLDTFMTLDQIRNFIKIIKEHPGSKLESDPYDKSLNKFILLSQIKIVIEISGAEIVENLENILECCDYILCQEEKKENEK